MPKIQRFFSKNHFQNFQKDISTGNNPLVKTIKNSGGELDLQFRPDNKFNIYCKGNSLANVHIQTNKYKVEIHQKFDPIGAANKDSKKRFSKHRFKKHGNYYSVSLNQKELLKFFQSGIIKALSSKIKLVNNGEEITFEQSLMTDNLNYEDLIIIDRQVGGGGIPGYLDLLALDKIERGRYKFVVLEVKLGNNKELKGDVVKQIESYIAAIKNNVKNFQECYEKNYQQKKEMGRFPSSFPDIIKIDKKVEGKIVVGLYSKIGRSYINELSANHSQWKLGENIVQF